MGTTVSNGWSLALRVLLGQDDLWQWGARTCLGYRVVCVDDRRAPVLWIDCNLEQVEQVARSGRTASAIRTDHTGVVRRVTHLTLREAGAIVRGLGQIGVPNSARIIFARGGRPVIHNVHGAVMSCDPRKERRGGWREVHCDGR